jgi:hypothetical protein
MQYRKHCQRTQELISKAKAAMKWEVKGKAVPKHHVMNTYMDGMAVKLHTFLTTDLDEGKWLYPKRKS